jgi:hypothetical protein
MPDPACLARTNLAPTNRSLPRLPCLARPGLSSPCPALPGLPCLSKLLEYNRNVRIYLETTELATLLRSPLAQPYSEPSTPY